MALHTTSYPMLALPVMDKRTGRRSAQIIETLDTIDMDQIDDAIERAFDEHGEEVFAVRGMSRPMPRVGQVIVLEF